MTIKKGDLKQFSVSFPKEITTEIDTICTSTHISRSAWLLKAAKEMLEKNRREKIEKIEKIKKGTMTEEL